MPNVTARYYQREAVDAQECAWFEYRRTVMKMPTGSGKTLTSSILTENSLPETTLFLGDQDELCDQPLRTFKRVSSIIPALERGKDRASLQSKVVVGSSQTLSRKVRRERFRRDHFQRIIIDEAHRGTDRDIEICDYFETALVCGLTATPFRAGLADLSKWFGTVAYKMEPVNFVDAGFAPPEILINLPVEIDLGGLKMGMTAEGKDYKAEGTHALIEPYFDAIAELLKEHAPGRHGIAFLPLIESSKEFAACLRRHGITAMHVDGELHDRQLIIESFSRGEFSWLINCGLVSTGVDIPIADAFLCLRPTRSPSWYQQAKGRTWRVLPGIVDHLPEKEQAAERRGLIAASAKPNTLVFDLLWQNDELGVCRPGDMYAENQYDARQIFERTKGKTDPAALAMIAAQVKAEREMAVVKALEAAAIKSGGIRVHADHVGALIGDNDLANYSPIAAWEMQPLSDRQKSALASFGVDPESVKCKGQAHKIMDAIGFRIRAGFATLKQVRLIKENNSHLPGPLQTQGVDQMTMEEASSEIERILRYRRGGV